MPAEPILAAAAVAGALGYGYVHYVRPVQRSGDADDYADASASKVSAAVTPSLHGQKKRGRKLQLPGDATLKNLDVLDAPVHVSRSASTSSAAGTRQRQRQHQPTQPQQHQQQREAPAAQSKDVVPGGFDGDVPSTNDTGHVSHQHTSQAHSQEQQHQASATAKKLKKKKGKKAGFVDPSGPSGAGSSSLASSALMEGAAVPASVGKGKKVSASASAAAAATADVHDEPWTRVEARKKKVTVLTQDDAGAAASPADVTTSDAGITTSVTGNSSPVTERTTEDELPPELDEWAFPLLSALVGVLIYLATCACPFL